MSSYSRTLVRETVVAQADETSASSTIPRLAESMLYTSDELKRGFPSIYKLRMRVEMSRTEDMIARQSIGKPDRIGRGKTEKVFMTVGATGAGKTTLINGMVNYILGVQWKDEFRFKVITEETKASQVTARLRISLLIHFILWQVQLCRTRLPLSTLRGLVERKG